MGEISDALRRAKAEKEAQEAAQSEVRSRPEPDASVAPDPVVEMPKDSFPLSLDMVTADVDCGQVEATPAPPRVDSPPPAPLAAEAFPLDSEPVAEETRQPEVTLSRERTGNWAARSVLVPESHTAEQYRHFAVRLGRELSRKNLRSVAIVSALREEGKTTTSCNLALASASIGGGRRTALVDLDLRRPSLARALDLHPQKGIDTVLAGHATLAEARLTTDLPELDLYPVAHAMNHAHERIAAPSLAKVIQELEESYDLVIFDSPPVLLVPDVALLAPHIGGYVAVLRSRRTMRQAFTKLLEILPSEKLLGTFLNDIRVRRLSKYHTTYYRSEEYAESTAE